MESSKDSKGAQNKTVTERMDNYYMHTYIQTYLFTIFLIAKKTKLINIHIYTLIKALKKFRSIQYIISLPTYIHPILMHKIQFKLHK